MGAHGPAALLPLLLVLPFLGALLLKVDAGYSRTLTASAAGLVMAAGFGLVLAMAPAVFAGETLLHVTPWLPQWGLDVSLRLDGLGMLFAGLITGIGTLIVLYATYYLPEGDDLSRFLSILLGFAGGMLGIVLAENILLMLFFWEITSLTSFLLIAYKSQYHDSRIAARLALAITGGGGLALLAGLILLGQIAGSYDLSVILASGDAIRAHPLYLPTLILILLGAFTKSAQFPFHIWLPTAMAAPTPVSAYLHSATMVKAGVFLLARLHPALAGSEAWLVLVAGAGAITFLLGAWLAMLKHDFKGLLAYSTISHLGLMTLLLGLNTEMAAIAALFHLINHAVFKASLFMAAGIIDHETGTRDMRRLNGLARFMPITATLAIIAAASMAGVPFLNGFLSKEMFFAETVAHPAFEGWGRAVLPIIATIGGILSAAYSARFVHDVFFNGQPVDLPRIPHEPARFMRLPVELLVVLVLLVGILPQMMVGDILKVAASGMLQGPLPAYKLAIWHGFNLPLLMSVVALGGGLLWFLNRHRLFQLTEQWTFGLPSPVAFERLLGRMTRGARSVLAGLDRQTLAANASLFLSACLLLGAVAWMGTPGPRALVGPLPATPADPLALGVFLMLALAVAGVTLAHERRLIAILYASVAGTVVTLTFVRFGGPDLALTQLTVEFATIMLLLLALRYLPVGIGRPPVRDAKVWHGLVAMASGLGAAAMVLAMLTRPFETISGFHIAEAKPGGGGTNVVNVILVDFRGFDTLGEIAVLAMAALGAQALLAGLALVPRVANATREADLHPIMLRQMMQPLLPLALAVALYVFLRGHNLPGGGFIAGLIAAIALILQYLATGIDVASRRIRFDMVAMLGVGLLVAAGTGLASLAFGLPFLTSTYGYVSLPFLQKFELASAMVFDFGIFLVVVATILLILTELGLLSRRDRAPAATAAGRPHAPVEA